MKCWHDDKASAGARRGARIAALFGAAFFASMAIGAAAQEMAVYKIVARDGVFEPATLEVPAGKRFKIEISNEGKGPIEFESRDLKQEKVLAAGAKTSVVINAQKPGTYVFFDDYHPDAPKGQIVVK